MVVNQVPLRAAMGSASGPAAGPASYRPGRISAREKTNGRGSGERSGAWSGFLIWRSAVVIRFLLCDSRGARWKHAPAPALRRWRFCFP